MDFTQIVEPTANTDLVACPKHPREKTALRCGKCDRPICTRCTVLSPAGTRCTECSRNQIAFRPETAARSFGLELKRLTRLGPMSWYAIAIVLSIGFSVFRSCGAQRRAPIVIEQDSTQSSSRIPEDTR
ncbi:MAG: hypothetical protein JNM85_01215 [Chthonomonas sp.]|nr:hypothetical protein [Chthonomonas sp.]